MQPEITTEYLKAQGLSHTFEHRFWDKTEPGENGCWIWTGATGWRGHPKISKGGRGDGHINGNRGAWILLRGPIPDGAKIRTKCHNKLCVNPAHMSVLNALDQSIKTPEFLIKDGYSATFAARFWRMIEKTNTCWLWAGHRTSDGYGKIQKACGKLMIVASRASWLLANGPIPPSQQVLHKCDCPPCVNPDHLFLGTQIDNIRDMVSKGRQRTGSGLHRVGVKYRSKLNWDDIRDIRGLHAIGASPTALSRQFHVNRGHISRIVSGRQWNRDH